MRPCKQGPFSACMFAGIIWTLGWQKSLRGLLVERLVLSPRAVKGGRHRGLGNSPPLPLLRALVGAEQQRAFTAEKPQRLDRLIRVKQAFESGLKRSFSFLCKCGKELCHGKQICDGKNVFGAEKQVTM